jgi:RHS repeat-associated protein
VKQSGQNDQLYYAHTDHLGSIVQLTDNNGNAVFNASYDAWGQQEVTTNTIGFSRGYTGHEHLPEFGLINMNGRMYDPLVGRFLSPDPFVQAPEYSQNFNRYSYCLNNPLIYTDPSGYWFGLDDLFVAVSGFVFNYVSYGLSTGNWGGKALAAGGIGAVTSWLGYNLFIRPDLIANPNNMPNPNFATFKHYMNLFNSDATQQYLWQTGSSTLINSYTNREKLTEADKNSWSAVWTISAYGLAGSLTQGADIDPSKVNVSRRLRQWGGIVLTNNISNNMNDDGIFELNSLHVGILGYNFKNNDLYSVFSKGLNGSQRFDMAFETLLGATMINKNIHYHGLETSRCNKGISGLRKSPVSKFMIPLSKIGEYSRKVYLMGDKYMFLYNGKTLFQYWYENHYENGLPKF